MLLSNKKFIGLSIDILEDETRLISYICLKKKNDGVTIESRKQNVLSIQELKGIFDSDSFVNLSINGKGIINKKINTNPAHIDSSQDKLVSLVLPNANPFEFYAQLHSSFNSFFISICRKNLIDKLIEELKIVSCFPVKLTIGPFELNSTLSLIKDKTVITNTYQIEVEENDIVEIQKLATDIYVEYAIEGEKINFCELIAFSSALAGVLERNEITNEIDSILENKQSMSFSFDFKKKFTVSLLIVFGVLLLNFLAYDYLFTEIERSKKFNNDVAQNQMADLKAQKEFNQKKQFIVQKNWNQKASISEIIELLSASTPSSLSIKEINYQPESNKKSSTTNTLKYQYKKIHVLGNVITSNQLNNWMKALVASTYFTDVSLQNYQVNATGAGNIFNLEITLK